MARRSFRRNRVVMPLGYKGPIPSDTNPGFYEDGTRIQGGVNTRGRGSGPGASPPQPFIRVLDTNSPEFQQSPRIQAQRNKNRPDFQQYQQNKDYGNINQQNLLNNNEGAGNNVFATNQPEIKRANKTPRGSKSVVDPGKVRTGSIDMQGINTWFSQWDPTSDWGRMMKGTYMMNTLQKYQDDEAAKGMAFTNAGIQQMNMKLASQLELHNKASLMTAEQRAALNMMGAQFNYQSRFAQDEYNRMIGKMGFDSDIQRALTSLKGDQTRANMATEGSVQRAGLREQGEQARLTQSQANIESQQQANLASQLQRGTASWMSGIKKDESSFMQGLRQGDQQFTQGLQKDTEAFRQGLGKDTSSWEAKLRREDATYGSGIKKDEASFMQGLSKDTSQFERAGRKDESAFIQALGKDTAGFGSKLRKDEAGYAQRLGKDTMGYEQALGKDTAAFTQGLGKDTQGYLSGLRKGEAAFGSALKKDERLQASNLAMREADFSNRLQARTRTDKSRMMSKAATAF